MSELIVEFSGYVKDIFENATHEELDQKLTTVLARFGDASVRQASSSMLELDVDCSGWEDALLAEKMLQHVAFRAGKTNMLPAHCMMPEASRRLRAAHIKS